RRGAGVAGQAVDRPRAPQARAAVPAGVPRPPDASSHRGTSVGLRQTALTRSPAHPSAAPPTPGARGASVGPRQTALTPLAPTPPPRTPGDRGASVGPSQTDLTR